MKPTTTSAMPNPASTWSAAGQGHHRHLAPSPINLRHGRPARGPGLRPALNRPKVPRHGSPRAEFGEHLHHQLRLGNAALLDNPNWSRCAARSTPTSVPCVRIFLTRKKNTIVPGSQTNFFMVDVKCPGGEFRDGHARPPDRHRPHLGRHCPPMCASASVPATSRPASRPPPPSAWTSPPPPSTALARCITPHSIPANDRYQVFP